MIQARFFIGDELIQYDFDQDDIDQAINDLSMLHLEKTGALPIAIFMSFDLHNHILKRSAQFHPGSLGHSITQFWTSNGMVMVKPVAEPQERFIYAGNQQGYENALIDKKFEEIILESQ